MRLCFYSKSAPQSNSGCEELRGEQTRAAKNMTPVNVVYSRSWNSFMINPYDQFFHCWAKRKTLPTWQPSLSDVMSRYTSLWSSHMLITSICLRATPELVFNNTWAVWTSKLLTCSWIYVYHDLKNLLSNEFCRQV